MATDHEAKGKELMVEAEGKLNATAGVCCASGPRIEEACELYVKAANSFKMGKKWTLAGNAFQEAGVLQLSIKRLHEAGSNFTEASKCYKKESMGDAIKCLSRAAEIYTEMGRQRMAAKHHESLAELYEAEECNNLQLAIEHYSTAAEMFNSETSTSAANKCLLNVAKLSSLQGDYDRAIEIYESIGRSALDSTLLKYTANDLFLRAALCHICVDASRALSMTDSYSESSPAFSDSREYALVRNMAQKVIEKDIDGFNEAIRAYESVTALGPWHKDMTKKIRKMLSGGPDLR